MYPLEIHHVPCPPAQTIIKLKLTKIKLKVSATGWMGDMLGVVTPTECPAVPVVNRLGTVSPTATCPAVPVWPCCWSGATCPRRCWRWRRTGCRWCCRPRPPTARRSPVRWRNYASRRGGWAWTRRTTPGEETTEEERVALRSTGCDGRSLKADVLVVMGGAYHDTGWGWDLAWGWLRVRPSLGLAGGET